MKNRIEIPDTELAVSPIGLGTLGAGIKWDGREADEIFDAYLDAGGNLIDTARVYQDWIPGEKGRSERTIGDWIAREKKRNQFVLMTKGGHPVYTKPTDDLHISRMTPNDMRKDLELSLKALRTDVIDIYLYHRDNPQQSIAEEVETMEQFRREGKIRYYGCSNWTAERMREADAYCREKGYRGLVVDQAMLNIGVKYMKPLSDDTLEYIKGDIMKYHRENHQNLAVAYTSVASGFFHKFLKSGEVSEPAYDTEGNLRIAELIKKITEKYEASVSQVLLGYLMCQDFQCVALYGPRNSEQILDVMKTLEIPFEKEDFAEAML